MKRTVAVLLAGALALAACGSDDEVGEPSDTAVETPTSDDQPSPTNTDASEDDAPAAEEPAETSADDEAPAEESETAAPVANGSLVFSNATNGGINYDPHISGNPFVNTFLYPVYARLIGEGPTGELEPMLAESWEFVDDASALRLVLRQGVTFHDGTPFDATAVKANIERGQTLETSSVRLDLMPISEVVVVDDYTVDLRLGSPASSLPAILSDRAGMMISPAAFDNDDLDLFPVGAGPYVVVDHQPGASITYAPFDGYWDDEMNQLESLEVQIQTDPEARLRALIDGQLDATGLNADQVAQAEEAGFAVASEPSGGVFILYVNTATPGLDDARVREAISLAIDRDAIAETVHAGRCEPTSQVFSLTTWAGNPDLSVDPFDVERARQLMDEAGYGDGLSLRGISINIPFYSTQLEIVQGMLSEIGIDLSVTPVDATEVVSQWVSGGADLTFSLFPGSIDPAKTVNSLFAPTALWNSGKYENPEIMALAADGLAATDLTERAGIYQELSGVAAADHFHIPICEPLSAVAARDGVEGVRSVRFTAYFNDAIVVE